MAIIHHEEHLIEKAPKQEPKVVLPQITIGKEIITILEKQNKALMDRQLTANGNFVDAIQELTMARKRIIVNNIERDSKGRITRIEMIVEPLVSN